MIRVLSEERSLSFYKDAFGLSPTPVKELNHEAQVLTRSPSYRTLTATRSKCSSGKARYP